jgi:AGCS family alanine or glycine:cation symporter
MMEPFIDTIVICTMTGLVIVLSGAYLAADDGIVGAALTAYAFNLNFGDFGALIVGFGLSLFAFSTMIAWSYYGDRCARFLFGKKAVLYYRIVFTLVIIVGAAVPLKLVWNIADITTILMALPNLLALFLLAGLVQRMKSDYFGRMNG